MAYKITIIKLYNQLNSGTKKGKIQTDSSNIKFWH